MSDGPLSVRMISPAAARNCGPILDVLRPELPAHGLALEVASGSGEHVVHFAKATPGLTWQPSDPSPAARASIAAWLSCEGCSNVNPPIHLDACAADWPVAALDVVVCINMLHISPWEATLGLLQGAGCNLKLGGLLCIYGPFVRTGMATAPSNLSFDADLRQRDSRWGLRNLEDVLGVASQAQLHLGRVVEMPANNLSVLLRKGPC